MCRRGSSSGKRAFTLIEVLIALAILAIAAVALLQLQVASIKLSDRASRQTRAALLAQARLAEATAEGFPEIGGSAGGFAGEENAGFRWETMVEEARDPALEDAGVRGLRRLAVTVRWNDGESERQVELTTLLADRGRHATAK